MTTPTTVKRPRRWLPLVAGAVTFLVVLAVLGSLVGDWAMRNAEMRTLVTRIEASEAAMGALQDDVTAIFAEYQGKDALSVQDREVLEQRLADAAEKGRVAIAAAGDEVASTRWLSWHREIGAAQRAYLPHNRAWQDYLARAAKDPAEFDVTQEDVNSTFQAAEGAVRAAVPRPPMYDLRNRVDLIFAPPPAVDDGTSQQA